MPDIEKLIAAAPEPNLAEFRYETLVRNDVVERAVKEFSPAVQQNFIDLLGYSAFAFDQFNRYPLQVQNFGMEADISREQLAHISDLEGLRRFKYEQLLRICWMDISNTYPYEQILTLLSRLADCIITKIIDFCVPPDEQAMIKQGLCIFGLGKLGAAELNFSSDIDLIFVSQNPEGSEAERNRFHKLLSDFIRTFCRLMEDREGQEFLYRVDLKLRPWGSSGPLVMSADETENYYAGSSDAWERLAWIRGRCIAGNPELGQQTIKQLQPFIFLRSLSADDLDKIIQIKADMTNARHRKGQWHVKTGAGGIRDIEFFVQILQLVNAAAIPELQVTNTLLTLYGLAGNCLIDSDAAEEIKNSYLFLRRLENRLQIKEEQQVHALPDETDARVIIAKSLNIRGEDDDHTLALFEELIATHQATARKYFEEILPDEKATPDVRDEAVISDLAKIAWNQEQAEKNLNRWVELNPETHIGQHRKELEILAGIFGASWYFTRYIFYRGTDVLDVLKNIDAMSVSVARIKNMEVEYSGDVEEDISHLISIKNEWMLTILAGYLLNHISLREMEYALTELASKILSSFFDRFVTPEISEQHGLAILAMGRMAGHEMTFGSDLDLIFLYNDEQGKDASNHARQIQKVLRYLGSLTPVGVLYEVDMRLRPHGTAGSLITTTNSFIEYHEQDREIWERQMMTRCSSIYDPGQFAERVMQRISACVYQQYEPSLLAGEIATMRERVENELGRPKNNFEIKRGKGGLMDVDFISHYFQLLHGADIPELQTCSTRRALELCAEQGLIKQELVTTLLENYDYLKKIEMILRLWDMKSVDQISLAHESNVVTARALGFDDEATDQFQQQLFSITGATREIFTELLNG